MAMLCAWHPSLTGWIKKKSMVSTQFSPPISPFLLADLKCEWTSVPSLFMPSSCCMRGQLPQDFLSFWLLIQVTWAWLSFFIFWMLSSISFTTSCSLLSLRPCGSADIPLDLCVSPNRASIASEWFRSFVDVGALNPCKLSPLSIRSDHSPPPSLIAFSKIWSVSNM